MLLPVIVYVVEDDATAQGLCNLTALGFVGLLEINGKSQLLLAVGDGDCNVLVHAPLLLIDGLDDGVHSLDHGVHTAGVYLLHVLGEFLGDLLLSGTLVEGFVKTKVYRKLSNHIFLKLLEAHAFALLHKDIGSILHHVLDVNLYAFSGEGVAAA